MKLSFLVTSHNEGAQLFKLLYALNEYLKIDTDTEIVLIDDYSTDVETVKTINYFGNIRNNFVHYHKLEKNYAAHKNYGTSKCVGDYIFALDADELPSMTLLYGLKDIIEANPEVDLFSVPRVNIVHGLTPEFVATFNWRFTPLPAFPNVPIVNWPDNQKRIYRKQDDIKWDRKLHEHIIGSKMSTKLPDSPEYALIHEKNIQKQLEQNLFYNAQFSPEDNVRVL